MAPRPRRFVPMIPGLPERIKALCKKLGEEADPIRGRPLRQEDFGALFGKSQPQVSRWFRGEDTPEDPVLKRMATLAETDFLSFKYGFNQSLTVPVSGYIRGEAISSDIGGDMEVQAVLAPYGLEDAAGVRALIVQDNSLRPHGPGTRIFYREVTGGVADDCMNALCIVQVEDGDMLIKNVRRGYQEGRYNLESWSGQADLMEDQQLAWASRVLSISP